jgi:hypothetical protein
VDLHPVDVRDDDAVRWLETLVWPEHDDRRARLAAAVAVAREDPPEVVRGDLLEELPALAASAPPEATLVVLHSAVLAYLSETDREDFTAMVGGLQAHWVSNEGPRVVPGIEVPEPAPTGSAVGAAPFLVSLDGRPQAWTHPHGRGLHWLG